MLQKLTKLCFIAVVVIMLVVANAIPAVATDGSATPDQPQQDISAPCVPPVPTVFPDSAPESIPEPEPEPRPEDVFTHEQVKAIERLSKSQAVSIGYEVEKRSEELFWCAIILGVCSALLVICIFSIIDEFSRRRELEKYHIKLVQALIDQGIVPAESRDALYDVTLPDIARKGETPSSRK